MLSQTAEYALRAMWYLARNSDQPQVIPHIAKGTEVSRDYLYKVLQQLVRGRLVRSRRGKGGGFVLARGPDAITLYDIVNAVSPRQQTTHCPLTNRAYCANNENGGPGLCPLHASMDEATQQFEKRLSEIRLSDLLKRIRTPRLAAGIWPHPFSASSKETPSRRAGKKLAPATPKRRPVRRQAGGRVPAA